jgi:peptidoglycan/LPS O-acetylase OafA/YrhL
VADRPARKTFPALEGLRGACAMVVMLGHWLQIFAPQDGILSYVATAGEPFGFIAVIVFFILSGFVIGHSVRPAPDRAAVKAYLLKRFIRLYPIYIAALTLSFLVAGVSIVSPYFAGHAVFLQNTFTDTIESNGPLWSLNNEVCYYIVFLVLWIYPRSLIPFWCAAIAAAIVASLDATWYFNLAGLFAFWLFGLSLSRHPQVLKNSVIDTTAPRFWLPFFLLGAYASSGMANAIMRRLGFDSGLAFMTFLNGALILDLFLGVLGKKIARPWAVPFYFLSATSVVAGLIYALQAQKFAGVANYWAAALYAALAVITLIFSLQSPSSAQWSRLAPIGGISYALYVVHFPIMFALSKYLPGHWPAAILAMPLAFATAAFLEGFMQPRIRRAFFYLIGGESGGGRAAELAAAQPDDVVRSYADR